MHVRACFEAFDIGVPMEDLELMLETQQLLSEVLTEYISTLLQVLLNSRLLTTDGVQKKLTNASASVSEKSKTFAGRGRSSNEQIPFFKKLQFANLVLGVGTKSNAIVLIDPILFSSFPQKVISLR